MQNLTKRWRSDISVDVAKVSESGPSYLRAVVRFGLQFIHGNQSLKKAAFKEAHWCLSIETSLWIGQDQFEGHSKSGHVHGEGATGTPAGVEANHLSGINTNKNWIVDNNSVDKTLNGTIKEV